MKEEPISEAEFGKALEQVITGICERGDESRRGTDPWKNLFAASEHGLKSLLSEANHQSSTITLSLADVIKKRFGIKRCSSKLYGLLQALPFAMSEVRDTIQDEQGNCCCADKARLVYYEEVLAEINRIIEEERH